MTPAARHAERSLGFQICNYVTDVLRGELAVKWRHDPFASFNCRCGFLGRDHGRRASDDSVKIRWPKRRGVSRLLVMAADALGFEDGFALLRLAAGRFLRHCDSDGSGQEHTSHGKQ